MFVEAGKVANDVAKVDSYRVFHRKMAKSMARNAIFTSVFLEISEKFRRRHREKVFRINIDV